MNEGFGKWVTSFIWGVVFVILFLFVIGSIFRIIEGEVP